jgi:hypothetical protein
LHPQERPHPEFHSKKYTLIVGWLAEHWTQKISTNKANKGRNYISPFSSSFSSIFSNPTNDNGNVDDGLNSNSGDGKNYYTFEEEDLPRGWAYKNPPPSPDIFFIYDNNIFQNTVSDDAFQNINQISSLQNVLLSSSSSSLPSSPNLQHLGNVSSHSKRQNVPTPPPSLVTQSGGGSLPSTPLSTSQPISVTVPPSHVREKVSNAISTSITNIEGMSSRNLSVTEPPNNVSNINRGSFLGSKFLLILVIINIFSFYERPQPPRPQSFSCEPAMDYFFNLGANVKLNEELNLSLIARFSY